MLNLFHFSCGNGSGGSCKCKKCCSSDGTCSGLSASVFDPNRAVNYSLGRLVVYKKTLYIVNKANPGGVPDSSSDYTALTGSRVPCTSAEPTVPQDIQEEVQGVKKITGGIDASGAGTLVGTADAAGASEPAGAAGADGSLSAVDADGKEIRTIPVNGFSVQRISANAVSGDYQFANPWAVSAVGYNDGNFDTSTGVYTVPENGVYLITAVIPYSTFNPGAVPLDKAAPLFGIRDNLATVIVSADLPTFVNGNKLYTAYDAAVTVAAQAKLQAGHRITLHYFANSAVTSYTFGPDDYRPAVWSVRRIV